MSNYTPSRLYFIQNNSTVQNIQANIPVVVILGGEKTDSVKHANFYADGMQKVLNENSLGHVPIFSAIYEFNDRNTKIDRYNLFQNAGQKPDPKSLGDQDALDMTNMQNNEPDPVFVRNLFDILIHPHLSNNESDMAHCFRNITIFTHCFGATVVQMLEKLITTEMVKIGYDKNITSEIQKNILCVNHAPCAPMRGSKFTTISFASGCDDILEHNNLFGKYVLNNYKQIKPSFLSGQNWDLFLTDRFSVVPQNEHLTTCLLNRSFLYDFTTRAGDKILAAEKNVLINGIRASIANAPIPSIAELASGNGVNFAKLEKSGKPFYEKMVNDLRRHRQNQEPVRRK